MTSSIYRRASQTTVRGDPFYGVFLCVWAFVENDLSGNVHAVDRIFLVYLASVMVLNGVVFATSCIKTDEDASYDTSIMMPSTAGLLEKHDSMIVDSAYSSRRLVSSIYLCLAASFRVAYQSGEHRRAFKYLARPARCFRDEVCGYYRGGT